jgi:hypothetical protein
MSRIPKKDSIVTALLTLGIFYFSFMILDRSLSLIYGFNFQPYGPWVPPGFTMWGHAANGSLAALGTYLTLRLYGYGEQENRLYLQILALAIFAVIGAVIPYMNDAEHLIKNGAGATLPVYIVANDLYVFTWGLLSFSSTSSCTCPGSLNSIGARVNDGNLSVFIFCQCQHINKRGEKSSFDKHYTTHGYVRAWRKS